MAELEGPLRARTTADAAAQTGVTVLDLEAMDDELLLSAVGATDDSSAEQQQPATEPDLEMGGGGSFRQQGQDGKWAHTQSQCLGSPFASAPAPNRVCDSLTVTHLVTD